VSDESLVPGRRPPIEVTSRAAQVTLYEDRAEVVRRARARLPAGISWVLVSGVTVLLDDASLVAGGRPGGGAGQGPESVRVVAARVLRRAVTIGPEEVRAAELDVQAAERRRDQAERALKRAQAAEERGATLGERWIAALERGPRGVREEGAQWRAAWQAIARAHTRALDEQGACRAELERAEHDLGRAQLRLVQVRTAEPRYEAAVEVQVEAAEAVEAELELRYRTPCALWRPEHLARLVPRSEGAPEGQGPGQGHDLVIRTLATVWQRTGEEWRDVVCRCSTARPSQGSTAPLLTDDVLYLRRKSEEERRTVTVEARDEVVAAAALERGARAVDEMPGVDDGGEPLVFEVGRPVSLPSDGQPVRLEVAEVALPCEVDLTAYPERSPAAYLRATALLVGKTPLLAGPVTVARGSELVGRGKLGFVAPGESFELGCGVDDGLRVRRRVDERRDTQALTGTQRIERTVTLYLGNMSGSPRRLTVVERVPVSEIGDVEVEVVSAGGAQVDADGFARFQVTVGPQKTAELVLVYRISAASKVQLAL
jgi:uncharacterized protein (TIGR02231 family)